MMKTNRNFTLVVQRVILLPALLLSACAGNPAATEISQPAEEANKAATEAATSEPIVHTVIPQTGTRPRANAHDHEESTTFDKKSVAAGDEFLKNQFERPFTAGDMTYLPDLDIVDFGITSDDQFFYIKILLAGLDRGSQTLTGSYGVEIDRNVDGRAELLLMTRPPYSAEFSADNVLVLIDVNGDVGGVRSTRPDESFSGDGFDGVIFDLSGDIHPDDPDLAWARVIEGERPSIEIAYRKWIFKDGNESFMWSVWASGSELNPLKFNLHDALTEQAAGSPNKDNANYPLKELAEIDNTCRVPLGFEAVGSEPLGCLVKGPEREPSGDDATGIGGCQLFRGVCDRLGSLDISDFK